MELNIFGYKCKKCGTIHYPNRTLCKKCMNETFDIVPLPKKGKLLTFTRLRTLPGDFEVPELLLGIVQLENGMRLTGQLDIGYPQIGMKVRGDVQVVRKDEYNKYYGMVFHTA